jgi:hypothetical protein
MFFRGFFLPSRFSTTESLPAEQGVFSVGILKGMEVTGFLL